MLASSRATLSLAISPGPSSGNVAYSIVLQTVANAEAAELCTAQVRVLRTCL